MSCVHVLYHLFWLNRLQLCIYLHSIKTTYLKKTQHIHLHVFDSACLRNVLTISYGIISCCYQQNTVVIYTHTSNSGKNDSKYFCPNLWNKLNEKKNTNLVKYFGKNWKKNEILENQWFYGHQSIHNHRVYCDFCVFGDCSKCSAILYDWNWKWTRSRQTKFNIVWK